MFAGQICRFRVKRNLPALSLPFENSFSVALVFDLQTPHFVVSHHQKMICRTDKLPRPETAGISEERNSCRDAPEKELGKDNIAYAKGNGRR